MEPPESNRLLPASKYERASGGPSFVRCAARPAPAAARAAGLPTAPNWKTSHVSCLTNPSPTDDMLVLAYCLPAEVVLIPAPDGTAQRQQLEAERRQPPGHGIQREIVMNQQLGSLDVHCDAPDYSIVTACRRMGF